MKMEKEERPGAAGMGVDAFGNPTVDPTKNVRDLVDASIKRLDDLAYLRAAHADEIRICDEKLREANLKRIDEVSALRAEFQEKLSLAEAKRIDAIRAVDVSAVAVASERAAQQAVVLANQVAASAETLRSLVATTATTVAQQLATVSGALNERLSTLEKASYVGSGRQAVSDPMLTELVNEMRGLRESRAGISGKSEGAGAMWGYVAAAIGILFGFSGLILTVYHVVTK